MYREKGLGLKKMNRIRKRLSSIRVKLGGRREEEPSLPHPPSVSEIFSASLDSYVEQP